MIHIHLLILIECVWRGPQPLAGRTVERLLNKYAASRAQPVDEVYASHLDTALFNTSISSYYCHRLSY